MKRMANVSEKNITKELDTDMLEDYSILPKDVSVYEISSSLFFASAKEYVEVIKSVGLASKILIIRMRHVPFIDSTGIQNFESVIKNLCDAGISVKLSGVNNDVKIDLDKNGITALVGEKNIYNAFDKAVHDATVEKVD